MKKETKRNVTLNDKQIASRLFSLYEDRKTRWDSFTQTMLADSMQISQPAVSQYMDGKLPFNTDVLLAFAKALECEPTALDPRFFVQRPAFRVIRKHRIVAILGTTSGKRSKETHVLMADIDLPEAVYAIDIDTDEYGDDLPQGSKLIIDPLATIVPNRKVVVWKVKSSAAKFYYLKKQTSKKVTLEDVHGTRVEIAHDDIRAIHAVRAEQYP